jgi:hypothetical protein
VHERLDHAELLPVAPGEGLDLAAEVQVEAAGQLVDPGARDAAAEVAQEAQQLPAARAGVADDVAGEVADPAARATPSRLGSRPSTLARPGWAG